MGHDTLSAQWAGGVRDGYPAGVPCWIDTTQPDPQAAAEFYRGLLGWKLEDMMPPNSPGQYFVARLHGRAPGAWPNVKIRLARDFGYGRRASTAARN
jgi:hypothetical protein